MTATGAVSARSTCGPTARRGVSGRNGASSSASNPPSGPTRTVQPSGLGVRNSCAAIPARSAITSPGRVTERGEVADRSDVGNAGPATLRGGFAHDRAQPRDRGRGPSVVPRDHAAPRAHRLDAVDAQLGAASRDLLDPGLGEGQREADRWIGFRLRVHRAARCELEHAGPDGSHVVAAPISDAVGGGDRFTHTDAPGALQVVTVGTGDGDVVVERTDEDVCDRILRRAPTRVH